MNSKWAKKVALMLVCVLALSTVLSSNAYVSAAKAKKVTKVTLNTNKVKLAVGEKSQLSVKSVKPAKASKKVTYTSNKKKVAKVSKSGLITAVAKGTARITATSKNNKKVKANVTVTVKKGTKNKGISMPKTLRLVEGGAKSTLKVTWNPVKTTVKKLTWTSSNVKAAKVSKGTVTPVGKGTAVITAKNTYGKSAKCTVTVVAKSVIPTPTPIPAEKEIVGKVNGTNTEYTAVKNAKNRVTFTVGGNAYNIALTDAMFTTVKGLASISSFDTKWDNLLASEQVVGTGKITLAGAKGATKTITVTGVNATVNGVYTAVWSKTNKTLTLTSASKPAKVITVSEEAGKFSISTTYKGDAYKVEVATATGNISLFDKANAKIASIEDKGTAGYLISVRTTNVTSNKVKFFQQV